MKLYSVIANVLLFSLVFCAISESASLDIAQFPLSSCLDPNPNLTPDNATMHHSSSALAVDPVAGVVYQAMYRASDWSGQLLAFKANPTTGSLDSNNDGVVNASDALWEAGNVITNENNNGSSRYPYSFYYPDSNCPTLCPNPLLTGTVFNSTKLSQFQKNEIDPSPMNLVPVTQYIAGSRQYEEPNGSYRSRTTLFGDVVNSDPFFVGADDFNYSSLPGTEGSTYQAFVTQKSQVVNGVTPRQKMVYVGGNDGMLHGFEAGTWNTSTNAFDTGHGTEVFNFLPGAIINANLSKRTSVSLTDTQTDSNGRINSVNHRYLVDGSPRAGDAYFSSAWHTILLGTAGASPISVVHAPDGRSIFALDVTNPGDFTNTATGVGKILWEFTDDYYMLHTTPLNSKVPLASDIDLGMTLSQPSLVRMQNGIWAVIVGNGYNNTSQKPVLYILDISKKPSDSKFVIAKITPCTASSTACPGSVNGLSTPIAVDVDFDHKVDYIYAGDLQGNLWKFDVNCSSRDATTGDNTSCQPNSSSTNWKVANNGKPLFVACDISSASCGIQDRQPITAKPQVGSVGPDQANALYSTNGTKASVMVYFGTGLYSSLCDVEASPPSITCAQQQNFSQQHTLYALWDHNTGSATTDNSISDRSKLLQQTILTDPISRTFTQADGTQATQTLTNVRATSSNTPCYLSTCTTQHRGWYMDLATQSNSPSERSVYFPTLLNGNVVFTTMNPTPDPCTTQPSGWVMELNAITGSRPGNPSFINLFGNNASGSTPSNDMVTVNSTTTMAPSGVQSTVGILKTPALIYNKGVPNKYFGGSGGGVQMITDPGLTLGRMSWRQLR